MSDEVEKDDDIERDEKGRLKSGGPSLNPNGRPKGTKSPVSSKRLNALMTKHGPDAIAEVAKIMKMAAEKKDTTTALKAAVWIGDKYMTYEMHKDRIIVSSEKAKASPKQKDDSVDDEEDSSDVPIKQVVFNMKAV